MARLHQGHFDEALRKYATRDPELYKELTTKVAPPAADAMTHVARHLGVSLEEPLTAHDGAVMPSGVAIAETIVRPNARR